MANTKKILLNKIEQAKYLHVFSYPNLGICDDEADKLNIPKEKRVCIPSDWSSTTRLGKLASVIVKPSNLHGTFSDEERFLIKALYLYYGLTSSYFGDLRQAIQELN